ncbi:hypothetical protein GCM10011369_22230 [Neiella marina]|uniref:Uncharacterized protein n=1 Tax=Neiella marina TaxID=508461 RepID=A0A8J2XPB2_9GAMM|nr:hypothetical protein [Neiella marina]GGA79803.1 hypothetical protein GCM10011369_22230 [Neiella marina]
MANVDNSICRPLGAKSNSAEDSQEMTSGLHLHDEKQKQLAHNLVSETLLSLQDEQPSPPFSN